ncbi:uncharacterized protein EI90DRAFT_1797790 [Cantharellus anzutake]|uniref:uncharacterized protein n=1 Tax=Cantharellus anzutake TaxID=1750568 RepID=UPI001905589E|nr:uncharacterized protein EI90DRAFT_1797790 [Cantharellus anzutake]KAF8327469.1 hypothetical protein EI90DRAFT_1797790 [Cantharellus anzutake]
MAQTMGWSEDRFVSPPPAFLVCGACIEILRDPVFICSEFHLVCRGCFHASYHCPICRRVVHHNDRPQMDINLSRLIDSLIIRCSSWKEGCNWTGSIRVESSHPPNCGFRGIKCQNQRCRKFPPVRDLDPHMRDRPHTACTNAPFREALHNSGKTFKHGLVHHPCNLFKCGVVDIAAQEQHYGKIHSELDFLRTRVAKLESILHMNVGGREAINTDFGGSGGLVTREGSTSHAKRWDLNHREPFTQTTNAEDESTAVKPNHLSEGPRKRARVQSLYDTVASLTSNVSILPSTLATMDDDEETALIVSKLDDDDSLEPPDGQGNKNEGSVPNTSGETKPGGVTSGMPADLTSHDNASRDQLANANGSSPIGSYCL